LDYDKMLDERFKPDDRMIKLDSGIAIKKEYDSAINKEYDKLNPRSNPSDDLVRKKEENIVKTILAYEDGISHQLLAETIDINRNNLRPYMERLIKRGLVTRDKGKHGKYYATNKARRGISLTADILANSFVSNILDNENFLIDIPSLETNIIPFSGLEYELLKLSNILGGFMIYAMIQSINLANNITERSRNAVEKDAAVEAWLKDITSLSMQDILSRFKSRVFLHLNSVDQILFDDLPPNASEQQIDHKDTKIVMDFFFQRPYFTLDQRIISELSACFSNLYPKFSRVLEKTRSDLPNLVAKEINHIRYLELASRVQKTCNHKYQRPLSSPDPDRLYDQRDMYEHCRKCHHSRWKKN
jgi:predicted transcriptional regulator